MVHLCKRRNQNKQRWVLSLSIWPEWPPLDLIMPVRYLHSVSLASRIDIWCFKVSLCTKKCYDSTRIRASFELNLSYLILLMFSVSLLPISFLSSLVVLRRLAVKPVVEKYILRGGAQTSFGLCCCGYKKTRSRVDRGRAKTEAVFLVSRMFTNQSEKTADWYSPQHSRRWRSSPARLLLRLDHRGFQCY